MDNRVYVVRCSDYSQANQKVSELLDMMGGMSQFVASDEKIALKANLLLAAKPEAAVTTHPRIVSAVASMAKKQGANLFIIDSPGSGYRYDPKTLTKTYRTTGMEQIAEEVGIDLNIDCSYREVSFPNGKMVKRVEAIAPLLDADGIFNVCKLKTHLFMYVTGAVKNNFGLIPGLAKPGYHAKLRDTGRFASMLLDLAELVSARLCIMDAVTAMEGEGPFAGDPRHVGLVLASTNPVAMDAVAGEIIGLRREDNPVLIEAEKRGWGPNRLEDVELMGIQASELRVSNFKTPATYYGESRSGGPQMVPTTDSSFIKTGLNA